MREWLCTTLINANPTIRDPNGAHMEQQGREEFGSLLLSLSFSILCWQRGPWRQEITNCQSAVFSKTRLSSFEKCDFPKPRYKASLEKIKMAGASEPSFPVVAIGRSRKASAPCKLARVPVLSHSIPSPSTAQSPCVGCHAGTDHVCATMSISPACFSFLLFA